MLKQLAGLTKQHLYNLGATVLVEQALFLALTDKIQWSRVNEDELRGEALLALPGEESVLTNVIFHKSVLEEVCVTYYLSLEARNGPCRNSADKNVAILAERIFGKTAKAA